MNNSALLTILWLALSVFLGLLAYRDPKDSLFGGPPVVRALLTGVLWAPAAGPCLVWGLVRLSRLLRQESPDLGSYVLIRDDMAGVIVGTLASLDGRSWRLTNARKIWSWTGAAAVEGIAARGIGEGSHVTACVEAQEGRCLTQILRVSEDIAPQLQDFPEWRP